MKSFLVFCLLFSMSCWGVLMPLTIAADENRSRHMPMDKILEFSLSRLKESIQKTAQKNDRLVFENEILRKNIVDLQQEKEDLIRNISTLSGKRSQPYLQQRELQLMETTDPEGRKQRTLELIRIFQRDIGRIKEEVQILENSLDGREYNSHKHMLLERNEVSEKSLIQAEKQLKSLEHKNRAPTEKIRSLQVKQNELVREIKALEGRLYRF